MKKALFIIALAVCGQGLQAASEPFFSIKTKTRNYYGVHTPAVTIAAGPVKYELNIYRLLKYAAQCSGYESGYFFSGGEWYTHASQEDRETQQTAVNNYNETNNNAALTAAARDAMMSNANYKALKARQLRNINVTMACKQVIAQVAADVVGDSVEPIIYQDSTKDGFFKAIVRYSIHQMFRVGAYNFVRNGLDGFIYPRNLRLPLFEFVCES